MTDHEQDILVAIVLLLRQNTESKMRRREFLLKERKKLFHPRNIPDGLHFPKMFPPPECESAHRDTRCITSFCEADIM